MNFGQDKRSGLYGVLSKVKTPERQRKFIPFQSFQTLFFWDGDSQCRCVWSLCLLLRAGIMGVYVAPHTENAGLLVEIFSLFNYTQSEITMWLDSENLIKTLLVTSAWLLLKWGSKHKSWQFNSEMKHNVWTNNCFTLMSSFFLNS